MADGTTTRITHATGFGDRKWRKIVVVHEIFSAVDFHPLDKLRIFRSTESEAGHDVSGATIKDTCAVNDRRKSAGLSKEGSNFI